MSGMAAGRAGGETMPQGGDPASGGLVLLVVLFWILLLVGGVFLVKWAVAHIGRGRPVLSGGPGTESALETLNRRYARGELSRREYLALQRAIRNREGPIP